MMRTNFSSFTSPSPSRSASSINLLLLGLEAKGAHGDLTTGHLSGRQVAGEGHRGRQVAPCKIYSYYSGRRCASHLELLGVDGAGAVGIEEVEGLTDLLLLLLGEVRSGAALGASASATVSLQGGNRSEQGSDYRSARPNSSPSTSSDRAARLPRWGAAADPHTCG